MTPQDHIEALLELAAKSPCSRDKRGAIVVRDGEILGRGFNAPVGGACSDDVCHVVNIRTIPGRNEFELDEEIRETRSCGGHVEHAEAMAVRNAIETCAEDAAHSTSGARYKSPILRRCELIHLNTCAHYRNGTLIARMAQPSRRRGCPSCAVLASGFGVDAVWLLHEDGWKRWSMAEYAKLAGVV